jgi:hypothetical protein
MITYTQNSQEEYTFVFSGQDSVLQYIEKLPQSEDTRRIIPILVSDRKKLKVFITILEKNPNFIQIMDGLHCIFLNKDITVNWKEPEDHDKIVYFQELATK